MKMVFCREPMSLDPSHLCTQKFVLRGRLQRREGVRRLGLRQLRPAQRRAAAVSLDLCTGRQHALPEVLHEGTRGVVLLRDRRRTPTPPDGAKQQDSPSGGSVVALLTGGALIVYQLGKRRILRAIVNEPVINLAPVESPIFCSEDSICVIGIGLELRKLRWSYTRNWIGNSFFYKPDEVIMRTPNLASKSTALLHFGGGYAVFPQRDDDDVSVKTQLALYVPCKLYQQEHTLVLMVDDPKGNVAEATGLILRNGGRFVDGQLQLDAGAILFGAVGRKNMTCESFSGRKTPCDWMTDCNRSTSSCTSCTTYSPRTCHGWCATRRWTWAAHHLLRNHLLVVLLAAQTA